MIYQVIWEDKAEQSLAKIDKTLAQKIFNKVEKYLVKDPISHGKPLTGKYKGYYRCRFSDYRIIYEVQETKLIILVVKIGHRKETY